MTPESQSAMLRWAHLPECLNPAVGWKVCSFTTVAEVIAGQSPDSDSCNDKGIGMPFLQGNAEFTSKFPEPANWCTAAPKMARAGDTLISVRAPVGEVNRADQDYAIGRGLAAVRRKGSNQNFIHQGLQRWRWCLQRVAQGTTFDAVTARHFSQLTVAVPESTDEQAAIACILDTVDTTIERTRAAFEWAKLLRRALLAELLSHGVDARGKVRRTGPRHQGFCKTKIGWLPSEWQLSSIGSEFELQNGFTLDEDRRPKLRKRRYLRVANVQRDVLKLGDVLELEAKDHEFAPRRLEKEDLLVVEGHADRMQIGRCARVTDAAVGMTFQNHLFRLRTRGSLVPAFACLWLNSTYAQRYWNACCATSSGLNTINQRMLKRLSIPVFSKEEQQSICECVQAQRSHLEALAAKGAALDHLKESLMHDLLTGKVRVNIKQLEPLLKS